MDFAFIRVTVIHQNRVEKFTISAEDEQPTVKKEDRQGGGMAPTFNSVGNSDFRGPIIALSTADFVIAHSKPPPIMVS